MRLCTELVKATCSASVQTRNRRARSANLARRKSFQQSSATTTRRSSRIMPVEPSLAANRARYTAKLLIHRSENLKRV
jgi:hypothetical protein